MNSLRDHGAISLRSALSVVNLLCLASEFEDMRFTKPDSEGLEKANKSRERIALPPLKLTDFQQMADQSGHLSRGGRRQEEAAKDYGIELAQIYFTATGSRPTRRNDPNRDTGQGYGEFRSFVSEALDFANLRASPDTVVEYVTRPWPLGVGDLIAYG